MDGPAAQQQPGAPVLLALHRTLQQPQAKEDTSAAGAAAARAGAAAQALAVAAGRAPAAAAAAAGAGAAGAAAAAAAAGAAAAARPAAAAAAVAAAHGAGGCGVGGAAALAQAAAAGAAVTGGGGASVAAAAAGLPLATVLGACPWVWVPAGPSTAPLGLMPLTVAPLATVARPLLGAWGHLVVEVVVALEEGPWGEVAAAEALGEVPHQGVVCRCPLGSWTPPSATRQSGSCSLCTTLVCWRPSCWMWPVWRSWRSWKMGRHSMLLTSSGRPSVTGCGCATPVASSSASANACAPPAASGRWLAGQRQ